MKDAHQKKWQLAIIVLNTDAPQVYPFIKQMGNQSLGLRTQCIDINVIQKNMKNLSMRMFLDNRMNQIERKYFLGFSRGKYQPKDQCQTRWNQWCCRYSIDIEMFIKR